jgi:tetratricopeptide (TPR) repeat protein
MSPTDERIPASLTSLANTLDELGRGAEAERYYKRALIMAEKNVGSSTTAWAVLAINLSAHYYEHGQPERSEPLLRKAITSLVLTEGPNDVRLALARNCLAGVLIVRKAYAEAEPLLQAALDIFDKNPETWRFRRAVALNNLGVLRRFQGRQQEGIALIEQAVALSEASLGMDHPGLIGELANLATSYEDLHRYDEAEVLLRRVIAIAEKRLGVEHPAYARGLSAYAKHLRMTGRKGEAKPMEARAVEILKENNRTNGHGMTVDVSSFR